MATGGYYSYGTAEDRVMRYWVDSSSTSSTSVIWNTWTTTYGSSDITTSTTSTTSTTGDTWYVWQGTVTGRIVTREPYVTTYETGLSYSRWVEEEVRKERRSRDQLAANRGDVSVAARALQREQEERRRRELASQMQRSTNKRRTADALERSMLLLRQACNDDQIRDLEETGSIVVVGRSGTRYKVTDKGSVANVHVLDRNNKVTHRLCAHPVGVPQGDIMLAQKLMLEYDEDAFVRKANRHLAAGY